MVFGPKGDPFVSGAEECLSRHGVAHDKFGVDEQRRRYPKFWLPSNYEVVLDKSGGILRADKMLKAFQVFFFVIQV